MPVKQKYLIGGLVVIILIIAVVVYMAMSKSNTKAVYTPENRPVPTITVTVTRPAEDAYRDGVDEILDMQVDLTDAVSGYFAGETDAPPPGKVLRALEDIDNHIEALYKTLEKVK